MVFAIEPYGDLNLSDIEPAQRSDLPSAKEMDKQCVLAAQAGDRAAFSALVERHYDFIYRTAYRWLGQASDAEDVTQDVCVKLATALAGFDGRSALTTWLYRITLNAVRDLQRARMARNKRHVALADDIGGASAPEQEGALADAALWQAVRNLPDKQRDAVLLVYAEEKSHAEAALILGVKESTISWQVHEARKTLKGVLA